MMGIIKPSEIEVTKLEYPKEQIEHLVDQIIRLNERKFENYSHQIDEAIKVLVEALKMMTKPYLVMKGDKL